MSDHMAFIMFFPPVLRPLAQVISSSSYKMVCGKTLQTMLDDLPVSRSAPGMPSTQAVVRGIMEGNANFATNNAPAPPLPGSNPADAERRRARALKTLEDRLRSITQDNPGAQEHLTKSMDAAVRNDSNLLEVTRNSSSSAETNCGISEQGLESGLGDAEGDERDK